MSKSEIIWNWFIGIFITLGNLSLLIIYAITKDCSPYKVVVAIFLLLYGIFKIAEMIEYSIKQLSNK